MTRASIAIFLVLLAAQVSPAQEPPRDYVTDTAGVIDRDTRARLNAILMELEQKTGAQFLVLTVPSTGGIPIEEYAIERAQTWGLGRKGKDDGLLLVIAVNDRKYRFETGYGLETILPDSLLGTVGRSMMVPAFRRGDYAKGIADAVGAVSATIAKAHGVELSGVPASSRVPRQKSSPLGPFLVFLAIALLFSVLAGRGRGRGVAEAVVLGTLLSGRGHRGGGGFGPFGGGFGSFGGGGGGSFGGGGASGGW